MINLPRAAIFIEGSNIYFAQKKIGFVVVTKPVKKIIDESGRELEKANFDVEITADILEVLPEINIVVLFSGDSDFAYLAKIIHKQRRSIEAYSSRGTLSWELKLSVDRYFLLEHLGRLTKKGKFARI